jgi:OFA family oxalate/formate antiporter-like MFS transporter
MKEVRVMGDQKNRGWYVTLAGTGINLALGVLYSWSVISKNIPKEWGWSEADRALPYTIACLVFALMMVPAGRLQDKVGPKLVASLGGILCGGGLILASQFTTLGMFILGFGVLAGTGIGFGYASATPPAVKWFPPAKTGMIAGIVVAGFGLASVYTAPLCNALIKAYSTVSTVDGVETVVPGVQGTLFVLGIAFLIAVVLLSQMLVNPPPKPAAAPGTASAAAPTARDYTATEILRTPQFYLLWVMYVFNAGAGLMIIGKLAKLVEVQASFKAGFILVALLAIGNAGGRLLAGTLSDKMGRIRIMQAFTVFQAALMFTTPFMTNGAVLVLLSMCIGMCYGSNLALFPSITKDYFGIKNFGVNYGLVFTAWGIGSLMALAAGKIYDKYQSFQYALFLAGALLVVSVVLTLAVRKPVEGTLNACGGCKSAVPEQTAICPSCGTQMA